jgi:GTP-binding protein HflX
LALNKVDLVDRSALNGETPGRAVGGAVLISALTGHGLDALRGELAALLATLWVDVDVRLPYQAGELLARVRERGTVELDYGNSDVGVRGRVASALASEIEAAAARHRDEPVLEPPGGAPVA